MKYWFVDGRNDEKLPIANQFVQRYYSNDFEPPKWYIDGPKCKQFQQILNAIFSF